MTTLTKPRKPRVRKTKILTPPAEPETPAAPPESPCPGCGRPESVCRETCRDPLQYPGPDTETGGEGAAERGEGGSGSSLAATPEETPTTEVPSSFVLDCPKCSGSAKYKGGACYRCKEKGHQDFQDLERNRTYDLGRHGRQWVALVVATVDGVERTKPLAFARATEVFRVDSLHDDGRIEKVVPARLQPGDRIVVGSTRLGRLLEARVESLQDVGPKEPGF